MTLSEKRELLALLEEKERRKKAESIDCSGMTREESNEVYRSIEAIDTLAQRHLCKTDLFYLLTVACKRKDIDRDWLYSRCREVQKNPDGYLDLWAREHYKSTIITFGKSIQDLLRDPEGTLIGIFSHTRPIAKGFLDQIKRELEQNEYLKKLFPDVLYQNPNSESPRWSLDGGIFVKRKNNAKEASVEAWGVVDGQPTSKHFTILVYDDVVTRESVTTPDQIKKVTGAWELSLNLGAHGGRKRYIGTRYHIHDTYRVMMDRGSVKPRIYAATENGKQDGNPVFLSKETLHEKRRDMGPYTYSCFPVGSPVLMSDWTDRPIEQIKVGDSVVGYSLEKGKKAKLVPSKVIAIRKKTSKVIEAKFESGRVVQCTPDHRWYTGRRGVDSGGTDSHLTYVPLGFDKNSVKSLASVYDPRIVNGEFDSNAASWLSGFFDGEGSTSGNTIHFHQTTDKNLIVCERLESVIKTLGFDYGITKIDRKNTKWAKSRDYFIRGGREEQIRFLRQCNPARSHKIIKSLFDNGTRNFGKANRDKLVSIKEVGEKEVFNIQTETGNYICYGYATKNCQMLQDPVADKAMSFKEEWLKYYESLGDTSKWNKYIIVDPASSKKSTSDYTVMEVIALAPDNNYYLIDAVRDRMNLTQRASKLFEFHKLYNPKSVGYEKYGMQADIEHMQYMMEQKNYRFNITELGGSVPKEDRIKKLIPIYEQKRFYTPKRLIFVDSEGVTRDYIQLFLADEYLAFPVCVHDDMLDCRARILDTTLGAEFPKVSAPVYKQSHYSSGGSTGWMG